MSKYIVRRYGSPSFVYVINDLEMSCFKSVLIVSMIFLKYCKHKLKIWNWLLWVEWQVATEVESSAMRLEWATWLTIPHYLPFCFPIWNRNCGMWSVWGHPGAQNYEEKNGREQQVLKIHSGRCYSALRRPSYCCLATLLKPKKELVTCILYALFVFVFFCLWSFLRSDLLVFVVPFLPSPFERPQLSGVVASCWLCWLAVSHPKCLLAARKEYRMQSIILAFLFVDAVIPNQCASCERSSGVWLEIIWLHWIHLQNYYSFTAENLFVGIVRGRTNECWW